MSIDMTSFCSYKINHHRGIVKPIEGVAGGGAYTSSGGLPVLSTAVRSTGTTGRAASSPRSSVHDSNVLQRLKFYN